MEEKVLKELESLREEVKELKALLTKKEDEVQVNEDEERKKEEEELRDCAKRIIDYFLKNEKGDYYYIDFDFNEELLNQAARHHFTVCDPDDFDSNEEISSGDENNYYCKGELKEIVVRCLNMTFERALSYYLSKSEDNLHSDGYYSWYESKYEDYGRCIVCKIYINKDEKGKIYHTNNVGFDIILCTEYISI